MSSIAAILLLTAAGSPQVGSPGPAPHPVPSAAPSAPAPATPSVVAAPVAPGPIGFSTAGELADRCQRQSVTDTNYCFAFIAGVHDTMQAYEKWLSTKEFCPPAPLSHSDLRRSFLTYVSAYPSSRDGVAASVIVVAIKQTYPC